MEGIKGKRKIVEKVEELPPLFPQGCRGVVRKTWNGVLNVIDGQIVEPDDSGVLRIKDERSPYNGMATADYIDFVVKHWLKAREKPKANSFNQARKEIKEELRGPGPGDCKLNTKLPLPPWPETVPRPNSCRV